MARLKNSIMEAYFQILINFEEDDWAKFLLIAKFIYNNVKYASTGHMSFKLNYGYYH